MRILFLGVSLVLLTVPAFAGDTGAAVPLLQQARAALQLSSMTDWSYRRTTVNKDSTYVEQYDPRAPAQQHWQLLSINGTVPTAEQQKTYADGKDPVNGGHLAKSRDGTRMGISHTTPGNLKKNQLIGCLPAQGLTKVAETADTVTYSFKPDCSALIAEVKHDIMTDKRSRKSAADRQDEATKAASTIRDLFSHTVGTVMIAKAGPYIQSIRLKNSEPFTEAHVVKIKTFVIDDRFAPAAPGGKTVLMRDDDTLLGTAFIFKTVEQHTDVSFSGFTRVPAASQADAPAASGT